MHPEKVSIIVTCYNQSAFLDETLACVLRQDFHDWECIIVNDGSTDETEKVATKWTNIDTRIKYIRQENQGLSAARNTGINAAKGVFILPLDADDLISADYIRLAIEAFDSDAALKVVYCQAEKFGVETGLWLLPDYSEYNLSRNNLIFCAALFRKEDWARVGGYDSNMKHGWEDWEFWIALLKTGGKVKRLEITGFFYRIKSASMLKNISREKEKELLEYLSVKHADFFVRNYGSFVQMEHNIKNQQSDFEAKTKSEKFVIDVFFKKFLGFSVFGKFK